jgi:hypothetical protein
MITVCTNTDNDDRPNELTTLPGYNISEQKKLYASKEK